MQGDSVNKYNYNIPYLPAYKSTFYRVDLKNCPRLIHGSKTEIKKNSGQIFGVIIVYLKENSKIKDKFSDFLAPKWGFTYTQNRLVLR